MSEGEQSANANHGVRPVVLPKSKLIVESIGYAEAINAGKSRYNEDQACIFQGQLRPKSDLGSSQKAQPINYLYFGLFDGHGGPGCAVKASKELQQIVHEGLDDALDYIVRAHKAEVEGDNKTLYGFLYIFTKNCTFTFKLSPTDGILDGNLLWLPKSTESKTKVSETA